MSKRYDVITEIKNLPFNIKNILGWSKVLWNNFDWSGVFLLEIIEYKLKRMKKYMQEDTVIIEENANKDVAEMNICLDALNHLISNDYEHELIEKFYEKYPQDLENWIKYVNNTWSKEKRKDFDEMHKKIDILNKKYKDQLFDMLKEKCDWWGD
jgi:hypothetical protein